MSLLGKASQLLERAAGLLALRSPAECVVVRWGEDLKEWKERAAMTAELAALSVRVVEIKRRLAAGELEGLKRPGRWTIRPGRPFWAETPDGDEPPGTAPVPA